MLEFLRSWTINIVTLVIFIVLLEILVPKGKIKKFINLVSGFILIIAIVNPLLGTMKNGIELKEFQVANSNFMDRKEIEQSGKILEEKQMKQITDVYRNKVIGQIEEHTKTINGIGDVQADVIINEDYKSQNFGEIKRVYLKLSMNNKNSVVKPVSRIEKVKVQTGNKNISTAIKKENNEIKDAGLKNKIEDKIAKLLDIKKENIVINISQ
ncbi:MAG: stage III sporulation protein AF [Clostridia bacterium]|nr:stage III sporulation protein AF [Clostridia bacterium]